jgi:hypothetical protein
MTFQVHLRRIRELRQAHLETALSMLELSIPGVHPGIIEVEIEVADDAVGLFFLCHIDICDTRLELENWGKDKLIA